ncbi:hypothetical protein C8F04DRAFT_1229248 [Mycena alexandri]|uniref:Uncharacterized protein n=1 Tax=Mycena alexandri TaxID=1745969 RepID=A0AAD6TC03_9AGAR|nr:hypothetical protein C8F04DRAFT_1229248 [Mycena alexandri]
MYTEDIYESSEHDVRLRDEIEKLGVIVERRGERKNQLKANVEDEWPREASVEPMDAPEEVIPVHWVTMTKITAKIVSHRPTCATATMRRLTISMGMRHCLLVGQRMERDCVRRKYKEHPASKLEARQLGKAQQPSRQSHRIYLKSRTTNWRLRLHALHASGLTLRGQFATLEVEPLVSVRKAGVHSGGVECECEHGAICGGVRQNQHQDRPSVGEDVGGVERGDVTRMCVE